MTRPKTQLTTVEAWRVNVITDNRTVVQAEVVVKDISGRYLTVGRGVARRRPGDQWDPQVGETIAVARAFEDAAQHARGELVRLGFGDVDTVGRPNVDRPPYFELYADKPGFVELDAYEAAEDAAERHFRYRHATPAPFEGPDAYTPTGEVKTPAEAAAEKKGRSRLNQVMAATWRAAGAGGRS